MPISKRINKGIMLYRKIISKCLLFVKPKKQIVGLRDICSAEVGLPLRYKQDI